MKFKSLRFKVIVIVAASLLLLFAVQFIVASAVLSKGYSSLESDKTRIQVQSARALIEEQFLQLSGVASDWAHWDDTYEYVTKPNQRYIESNYTDETFDHLKVNAILIADPKGEIVYQRGFDSVSWKPWKIPLTLQNAIGKNGVLTKLPESGVISGLMWMPEGLMIVSAIDILPSASKGKRRGVMVMVRRLDQLLIRKIEGVLDVRVSIAHLTGDRKLTSDMRLAAEEMTAQSGLLVRPLNEREVAGYALMPALGGGTELLMRTVSDRGIYEQGQASLNFIVWSTGVIVLVLAVFSWLFDKLVLARLATLSNSVREIGDLAGTTARVIDITGDDELSSLAHSINGMLDQLDESDHSMRELSTQMSYQARHDGLTDLINRYEFDRLVQDAIEDTHHAKRTHCVAHFDIDQFKVINDSCGHMVGDDLIKQLANELRSHVRDSDSLARLGGDEFALLLKGCELDVARRVCEKVLHVVQDFRFTHDDKLFKITASAGLSEINPEHPSTLSELLSAMDAACYVAKEAGGNRVHVFHPDDQELTKRHSQMEWVARIHEAIEKNLFRVYYQRMETLSAGLDLHCEMLIRLHGEDGTVYAPGYFLPTAERYQLMPQIDRWMVREVLTILARKGSSYPYVCAINLSGQSFSDEDFMGFVIEQIRQKGISPKRICFEITETAVIANISRAKYFIETLKKMGCSFSLDDFGSGLSSFGYLKNLNVDYLKIDGMFIKNIISNSIDRSMVEAINHVGHVMKLHTIAEFAENTEIIEQLREMGIDYAQGYGVAKPEIFE